MTLRSITSVAALVLAGALWAGCGQEVGQPAPTVPTDPSQLAPPPSGQGIQLMTQAFDVPAGEEVQACYFYKVSDLLAANGMDPTQPLDLHRIQIVQKPGSHHMNLFRVRTTTGLDPANGAVQVGINGVGQCFVSSNWSDWPLIANSQQDGNQDWTYPDGVANVISPDETLMIQTHYVNAATQGTPDGVGQVGINLYAMDPGTKQFELGTIFATNQSIRVCESNPTPTYSASCQFNSPSPVHIVGANGHFHSRGREFDMFSWDGTSTTTPDVSQRFYQSLTWADPPMPHSPSLDVQIQPGGGIWYTCGYDWQDPGTLTNGEDTCATLNALDAKKYQTPASQ
ncbi:MAG: hypothetical protein ACRELB_02020, partial [Polyangiaceae bacterium]